jgi:protein phosphatase
VALLPTYACVAHVGDSRAYRYKAGELRQITKDHSLVRELVEVGGLDPGSLEYFLHRSVLTRALGLLQEVEVDVFELADTGPGDLLLVSTDGLHEVVTHEELRRAIERHGEDIQSLCHQLVDLARDRGGPDNISVGAALVE